ncbi:dsDNA nuclease domain-containing protein [Kibdelosporangium philippinense]|uniref:dsDNA nuclease domain-containing protein n=1 Tax=Kibdelosporangium philippinense TaxID=211113 RepID=UPI003619C136
MAEPDIANGPSPPSVVVPTDDTGAPTSSRYRYQYQLAAAHCMSMLRNDGRAVVCEWHADFLLHRADGQWELVSVKHLDEGSWSFSKLFDDGGLALLFDTWIGLKRPAGVRLCTNGGFSTTKSPISARAIEDVCGEQLALVVISDEMCCAVAWAVLKVAAKNKLDNLPSVEKIPLIAEWTSPDGLPAGMMDAAREFLQSLRIEKFPARQNIHDHVIRRYVEPELRKLGRDTRTADVCYERLLTLIDRASRDNDGVPLDPLDRLTDPATMTLSGKLDERMQRRTITMEQVLECLAMAHTDVAPLLPAGRRPPRAPGGRKLTAKLHDGGISDEDKQQALDLRDLWHDSWPRVTTGFPQDIEVEFALEQEILDLVRTLRLELAGQDRYGVRFMAALHQRLRLDTLRGRPALPLHDRHLVGLAYELSDQCRFGFVDEGAAQ